MTLWILTTVATVDSHYLSGTPEIELLSGPACAAILGGDQVLPMTEESAFVISLELDIAITTDLQEVLSNDYDSRRCHQRMTTAFNASLERFYLTLAKKELEYELLEAVLNDEITDRPIKRSPAVALSVALGLTNTVATSGYFVYSLYHFQRLKERIAKLELLTDELLITQSIFENRAKFLHYDTEFLKLSSKLAYDHFDLLKTVHICDSILLTFDAKLRELKVRLSNIMQALDSHHLTRDIIDPELLAELTAQDVFRQTVFVYAPSLLYEYGRIYLKSVQTTHIDILVVFPNIEINANYRLLELTDADSQFNFANIYGSTLLLPISIPLSEISDHVSDLRHADKCLYNTHFISCQTGFPISETYAQCLVKLFANDLTDEKCFLKKDTAPVARTANSYGTLLRSDIGAIVTDLSTEIVKIRSEGKVCHFLEKDIPYEVLTPETLFIVGKTVPKVRMNIDDGRIDRQEIKNLIAIALADHNISMPVYDNPFQYNATSIQTISPFIKLLNTRFTECTIIICVVSISIVACIFLPRCLRRNNTDNVGNVAIVYGPRHEP